MTTIRHAATIAAALLTLAALAGCTSNPVAAHASSAAPTQAASTPAATPTTPPPTQIAANATPVTITCKKLVPTATVLALDATFTAVPSWTPAAGTPSARLADLKGTTCSWTTTAGDLLEVSVAKPSATDATALKDDLVLRSQSVPTFGGEAYFQVVDHVGQADVFRGRTWLFVRSNKFYEPGDATAVVAAALKALGYGPKTPATTTPTPGSTPLATSTGIPS